MNITEVRVKMVNDETERLRAFCSVTFDESFVIRDLKVIDGSNGPFVAMPSRKLSDRCPGCGSKNHLRARFCNDCGAALNENRAPRDAEGRIKLHADVAHPINASCREQIQEAVIVAYTEELELSDEQGYHESTEDGGAANEDQAFDDGSTTVGVEEDVEDDVATSEDQTFDEDVITTDDVEDDAEDHVADDAESVEDQSFGAGITNGDDKTKPKSDYEEFLSDLRESVGKRREVADEERHVEYDNRQSSPAPTDQPVSVKTETEKQPALSPDDDTFGAGIL